MRYIDHHAHMVSRTTDDYQQLALTGCVAVTEPAFWAGWDRSCGDSVEDYFRQLTEFEPRRAARFGIHFKSDRFRLPVVSRLDRLIEIGFQRKSEWRQKTAQLFGREG